jgi:hypothetical protein
MGRRHESTQVRVSVTSIAFHELSLRRLLVEYVEAFGGARMGTSLSQVDWLLSISGKEA